MNTKEGTRYKTRYMIEAGPGKDAIFDACKYAYDDFANVSLEFGVAVAYTRPPENPHAAYIPMEISDLRVSGISHEDGSGHSLLIHGYCDAVDSIKNKKGTYRFEAVYNTKARKGFMTFF